MSSSSSPAVLALFCALSIVWTWPLGAHLASRIPHDPGDPVLNTYLLWWNATAVPLTAGWWNPPFFFPMRGALALSEHLAGLAPISSPVQWLGGNPVLAYNVSLLASYALSAWFAYLLVRRLTGSTIAGVCAGLAYGFAPYRAGQLAHLQVLSSHWLPLQLLAMHGYVSDGRRRWLGVAGGAWLLQGLSNGYYLLFTPVLVALWLAWFPDWQRDRRRAVMLAGALAIASLPFVPLLLEYRAVHGALGLARGAEEIASFSARPASYLNPPHLLAFWAPRWVSQEDALFPGITVLALIVAAAAASIASGRIRSVFQRRSALAFYAGAALVMAILSFGPGAPGTPQWIRPYYWLAHLPGFDALRVPARFAMLVTLCAAAAAGIAVARLIPRHRIAAAAFVTAVVAGLAIDGWMEPMPLNPPPGRQMLSQVPQDAAVLELPPDDPYVSIEAMYRALFHRRPLINGYSGHFPPHYLILGQSLRRRDPSALVELSRGRPLAILVNDRHDPARDFRNLVESLPGVTRTSSGAAGSLYIVPARARERIAASGAALPAITTTLPREHLLVDLGALRTVRTIEFPLRWHYPELGERLAVEASLDGNAWETTWEGSTGGRALAGALEDPKEVPFRLPLPDISARYLRIHPAPYWLARDLRILGP